MIPDGISQLVCQICICLWCSCTGRGLDLREILPTGGQKPFQLEVFVFALGIFAKGLPLAWGHELLMGSACVEDGLEAFGGTVLYAGNEDFCSLICCGKFGFGGGGKRDGTDIVGFTTCRCWSWAVVCWGTRRGVDPGIQTPT